jgi:FtsH-binding integral membrane protein
MASYREMDYPYEVDERSAVSSARVDFIRRTYAHVAGALLAWIALVAIFLQALPPEKAVRLLNPTSPLSAIVILGAFLVVPMIAGAMARSQAGPAIQYAGLALYILLEAVITVPLIALAMYYCKDPNLIPTAGILTLMMFGGLTIAVFTTRKDFSFLRPILALGFMIMLGVAIAAYFFGFSLGLLFCFIMVALLSAAILYETSNVMLHYRTDQHVAAALALFAAVASMFWWILSILIEMSNSRN